MADYTIDEIAELLSFTSQSNPPFYGETIQCWQDNKIVLYKVHRTMKKEIEGTTHVNKKHGLER